MRQGQPAGLLLLWFAEPASPVASTVEGGNGDEPARVILGKQIVLSANRKDYEPDMIGSACFNVFRCGGDRPRAAGGRVSRCCSVLARAGWSVSRRTTLDCCYPPSRAQASQQWQLRPLDTETAAATGRLNVSDGQEGFARTVCGVWNDLLELLSLQGPELSSRVPPPSSQALVFFRPPFNASFLVRRRISFHTIISHRHRRRANRSGPTPIHPYARPKCCLLRLLQRPQGGSRAPSPRVSARLCHQ